jgi:hypothetical protein
MLVTVAIIPDDVADVDHGVYLYLFCVYDEQRYENR